MWDQGRLGAPVPAHARRGGVKGLSCKFACNSDPLRGDFRVQFRPLLTFCVSVLPFGTEEPGRTLGDDWRGQVTLKRPGRRLAPAPRTCSRATRSGAPAT